MNITKKLLIIFSGAFLLLPTSVFAGGDSGFYIGAGVGDAPVEAVNFDESDFAYKIFGGYNFGLVPLVDLAVEISYVDFGNPSNQNLNVGVTGLNAFGLAGLKFGPFGVFAKVGMSSWNLKLAGDSIRLSDSGFDPAYGIGAKLQFSSFAVRAEYEYFDLARSSDVSLLSVSAVYTF